MPPRKDDKDARQLSNALRYLRQDRHLKQEDVIGRVRQNGGSISGIYYSLLERGRNYPSDDMLATLLQALDSSHEELEGLLSRPPWGSGSEPRMRITPQGLGMARRASAGGVSEYLIPSSSTLPISAENQEVALPPEILEFVDRYSSLPPKSRKEIIRRMREIEGELKGS